MSIALAHPFAFWLVAVGAVSGIVWSFWHSTKIGYGEPLVYGALAGASLFFVVPILIWAATGYWPWH